MISIPTVAIWPRMLINIHLSIVFVFTATGKLIARHTVPESLSQYMAICSDGEKPLMVLYLVTQLKFQRVLCFTSTLEATHRYLHCIKPTMIYVARCITYEWVTRPKEFNLYVTYHEKKRKILFLWFT